MPDEKRGRGRPRKTVDGTTPDGTDESPINTNELIQSDSGGKIFMSHESTPQGTAISNMLNPRPLPDKDTVKMKTFEGTIVSIHQSNYLPGIRLIEKIAMSDIFIYLDNVKLSHQSWQTRNLIRTLGGNSLITIPVTGPSNQMINQAMINENTQWRKKHLSTLEQTYSKMPFWGILKPQLAEIYNNRGFTKLIDISHALTQLILNHLHIKTIILTETPEIPETNDRNWRLIDMTKAVKGTHYISSAGSRDYIIEETWKRAGIEHQYQQFDRAPYMEIFPNFNDRLSAIDYCMFMDHLPKEVMRDA